MPDTTSPDTTDSDTTVSVTVDEAGQGSRLDQFLAKSLAEISRARVQALIRDGEVTKCAETISDASLRVKLGEVYEVCLPAPEPAGVEGEAMDLVVVHEDAHVIVIDKPAGLVVHPAAGHASGTLVNALVAHCGNSLSGIGGVKRPGIVHRLDKDTSGLIVVAKTDAAHQSLSDQFKSHGEDGRLYRAYLALVWGILPLPKGTIDAPLTRSVANRTKIAVARSAAGRRAVTHYEVLDTIPGEKETGTVTLVRLVLETGRTHQIRVHLAHIGHPVLGDQTYGTGFKTRINSLNEAAQAALEHLNRQALHAANLTFEHPESHEEMAFESELPSDIAALLKALRGKSKTAKRASPRKLQPHVQSAKSKK